MTNAKLPVLSLADSLAQMRTLLAIERTLLAYIRSALAIFIAGVGMIQFFEHPAFQWTGLGLLPVGGVTIVLGIYRYFRLRERVLRGYATFLQDANEELESEE